MLPFATRRQGNLPDVGLLSAAGWSVQSLTGCYAVVFRDATEVVFVWRNDEWHCLATRALASHFPRQAA